MSRASYHANKAQGLCGSCGLRPHLPGQSRCDPCRARVLRQQYLYTHYPFPAQRARHPELLEALDDTPAPPLLAHCGVWHEVHTVPFVTPCCRTHFFEEA